MTIGTAGNRVSLNCDGVTKIFPVNLQAYLASDFTVYLTAPASAGGAQSILTLNSDYSIATSSTDSPPKWTLTTLAANAYLANYSLQVFVNPAQVQQTSYVQGQAFPSLAMQTNLDRLTQMVQRVEDQVSRAVRAPDGDVNPLLSLPSAIQRALTYMTFDASGNASTAVGLVAGTVLSAAIIGAFLYPQTAAEAAAVVVPTSYLYPELHVHRYGAVGDGATDDTAAWQAAINVAQTGRATAGSISCKQSPYLVTGLTISGPVTIDGLNTALENASGAGNGAQLRTVTNGALITYQGAAGVNNGVGLRNINLVGNSTGGSQVGVLFNSVYPAYTRIFMKNVTVYNMGLYGIYAKSVYTSTFENVYVQGCSSGIVTGPNAGANRWIACYAVANTSVGFDIGSTNGTDAFIACVSEQNNYGVVFEAGAIANIFTRLHTESNTTNSVWFKAASARNLVDFEAQGAGGEVILDQGTQNHVTGFIFSGGVLYDPKPIQSVTTAIVPGNNGSALTATPYSAALPTSAQGLLAATVNITPCKPGAVGVGNKWIARATGTAEIGNAGVMTVFLLQAGVCVAARGFQTAGGVPVGFSIEAEGTFTGGGANVFTLRVSSSVAADSVTLGGHTAVAFYGGAEIGNLKVQEWLTSS